jgi:hypothetical protein
VGCGIILVASTVRGAPSRVQGFDQERRQGKILWAGGGLEGSLGQASASPSRLFEARFDRGSASIFHLSVAISYKRFTNVSNAGFPPAPVGPPAWVKSGYVGFSASAVAAISVASECLYAVNRGRKPGYGICVSNVAWSSATSSKQPANAAPASLSELMSFPCSFPRARSRPSAARRTDVKRRLRSDARNVGKCCEMTQFPKCASSRASAIKSRNCERVFSGTRASLASRKAASSSGPGSPEYRSSSRMRHRRRPHKGRRGDQMRSLVFGDQPSRA